MPQTKIWHLKVEQPAKDALLRKFEAVFSDAACKTCSGVCCSDCAAEDGYLGRAGLSPSAIIRLKFKYGFDKTKGFVGDKGCKIPLEERSPVCVLYYCGARPKFVHQFQKPAPGELLPEKLQEMLTFKWDDFAEALSHQITLNESR